VFWFSQGEEDITSFSMSFQRRGEKPAPWDIRIRVLEEEVRGGV
jgi:hypothetical protein